MELAIEVPLAQAEVCIAGFRAFPRVVGGERNMKHHTKTRWLLGDEAKTLPTPAAA